MAHKYTVQNSAGRKVSFVAANDDEVRGIASSKFDRMYEKNGDADLIPVAWDLCILKKETIRGH